MSEVIHSIETVHDRPLTMQSIHEFRGCDIPADLSALYLERAVVSRQPHDLFRALASALEALDSDKSCETALFNKALALEYLSLFEEAEAAWAVYPGAQSKASFQSGWAAEASSHWHRLRALKGNEAWSDTRPRLDAAALDHNHACVMTLVRSHPQASRLYGEQELLAAWAKAVSRSQGGAATRALAIAREIGATSRRLFGDSMLSESVAAIDLANRERDTRRYRLLARGQLAYGDALLSYEHFNPQSGRLFASAVADFSAGGSPLALWAQLYRALSYYHAGRYDAARAILTKLHVASARFPNLRGRQLWLEGLIASILGDPMQALQSLAAAIACFERTGEAGNEAAIHEQLAEVLFFLGQEEEAWRELHAGLRGLSSVLEPRLQQAVLQGAAYRALLEGEANLALLFEDAALKTARAVGSPVPIALALRERAAILRRLGRLEEALTEAESAEALAREVRDQALMADVLISHAEVLSDVDPRTAVSLLTKAWPLLRDTSYVAKFPSFYLIRGRLEVALRNTREAEDDFRAGIIALEDLRSNLAPDLRASFFDQYRALFDGMLTLAIAHYNDATGATAFGYAEQARSRSLFDFIAGASQEAKKASLPVRVVSLAELIGTLQEHVSVLEFALLDDKMLVWVVRRNYSNLVTVSIDASRLQHLTTSLQMLSKSPEEKREFEKITNLLSHLLLDPLAGLIPRQDTLVIVPDKFLGRIPFSALKSPNSARYLINDHRVVVSPSSSIYLRGLARPRALSTIQPTVLVIGNPAFDRRLAVDAPDLPLAAQEARDVATLYRIRGGKVRLLLGQEATRSRFLADAGEYRVLHFGGHAEVDANDPAFSRFLFASTPQDTGVLLARDLYGRRFARTELVVLAACNTAAGRVSQSEGVMNLARPFLAGGARNVVASLWAVEDRVAREFSLRFHRAFLESGDAPSAFRSAQQSLIEDPDKSLSAPPAWGAFVLLGGLALPTK